ncbi:unnamed protein product, partial [Ascophyllum nodosum]
AFSSSPIEISCRDPRRFFHATMSEQVEATANENNSSVADVQLSPSYIPRVLSIVPTTGPCGTPLFVSGAHFSNTQGLACSFGEVDVPVRWISAELIQCDSP